MRLKQKITSLLLALCLVAGLLPTVALADDSTTTDKTIMMGTSGISGPTETTVEGDGSYYTPSDYIWYGAYEQDSTVEGAEPIKWRVLSTSGNATGTSDSLSDGTNTVTNDKALFLLSEYLLASGVYFQENYHYDSGTYYKGSSHNADITEALANAWQGSDAQTWAKDFAGESGSSVADAFSSGEQAALLATTKTDGATSIYDISWAESSLSSDKVFFLSAEELSQYVGSYDYAPGLKAAPAGSETAGVWWLRSPILSNSDLAGVVYPFGTVLTDGVRYGRAVRPALNLNLNSVLFTSAAEGGKADKAGDGISEINAYDGNEWKLTLLDNSRDFSVSNTEISGNDVSFSYSNAKTGAKEYISAVIVDNGTITHYGRIKQLDGTTNGESGMATLALPDGITLDNDTKLYVFNEQYNGGEKDDNKLTDYASQLIEVAVASTTYTITYDANGGSGTMASGTATDGTAFTLPANGFTAPTGKQFKCWAIGSAGGTQVNAAATHTFTANTTVYAVWEDIAPLTTTYTVDMNGGGTSASGAGDYAKDATVTIKAGTRSGYTFKNWTTEDGVTFDNANSAETTFTMPDKAVTVTANWTYNGGGGGGISYSYYTIDATAGAGGSITPSGSASVREGLDKTYTIKANEGYAISNVLVDGVSVGKVESYTFKNVQKGHSIEAVFTAEDPNTGADLPFTDVKDNDWFKDDVVYVYENGLMKGTSATTFSPNATTTRGMIVTILYRLEDEPAVSGSCPFDDVKSGSYYEDAITWAAANGIVTGYDNGKFGPNDPITREQLAAILWRYAKYQGEDVSVGEDTNILSYTDAEEISEYAVAAMQWACGAGIIQGTSSSTLSPQGTATRAQAAAMLQRYLA